MNQPAKNALSRMAKPLTPRQRSLLGGMADGARRLLIARGAIDADEETAKQWRHRESREATKALDPQGIGWTISEAPKHAFDALSARFDMLSGKADKALETLAGPDNEARNLTHNIATAARECGVSEAYIGGICRRMFGRADWRGAKEGEAVLIALKNKLRAMQRQQQATES